MKNSNDHYKEKTKFNIYSKKLKLIYVFVAIITALAIFLNICFMSSHSSVYKNEDFELEFARFCYNLVDAKLNLKSPEHIEQFYLESYDKAVGKNSADVFDTYHYSDITESTAVSPSSPDITDTYTYRINPDGSTSISQSTQAVENRTSYDDNTDATIQTDRTTTSSVSKNYNIEYTQNKIQERTDDLNKIINDLANTTNFAYIIIDTKTSKILDTNIYANPNITATLNPNSNVYSFTYSNTKGDSQTFENPVDILKLQNHSISFVAGKANGSLYGNYESSIESLIQKTETSNYSVYCGIIEPIRLNANGIPDSFYDQYTAHNTILPRYKTAMTATLVLGALFIIALILIAITAGQQEKHGEVKLLKTDQLYFDLHTLLLLFIVLLTLSGSFYSSDTPAFLLSTLLGLNYYSCGIRQLKAKTILKNTIIYRIFKSIKNLFTDVKTLLQAGQHYPLVLFVSVILILCFLNGVLYFYMIVNTYMNDIGLLIIFGIVLLDLLFIAWIMHQFISINLIKLGTKEITSGNVSYDIPTTKMSGHLKTFAEDISHIQAGLTRAVDEAVKGERLKTELITNVSHDLKTPLTSIINYVDLLKKEELGNAKAQEYITILEEKSARLKQLIEDLVEASKASSGSLSVTVEKVDLQQLILQACGEYSERLSKIGLDVRINYTGNGILVCADGKHLWRVVENLLSNIAKYAQPDSRVYIDIHQNSDYGILTVKNISKDPLDISANELTQRFVRGDSSRTTEGSGLGLSIAQSLTLLQQGNFNISIDGDLFKVVIEVPLWK